jgi:hypothetical protein
VSCLSAMLNSSSTLDFSHSRQLQRQCLRTLGIIITSSPPSTFSMLFAQQLPSVLCQCLDSGEESDQPMDTLRRGPRLGTEEMNLASSVGSRLTSYAYCAHTLALLLHTVSSQWGNIPFPLEVILVPGLLNDFDQLPSASPLSSRGNKMEAFGVGDAPSDNRGNGEGESLLDSSHASDTSLTRSAEAMYSTTGAEKVSLRQVSTLTGN